MLYPDGIRADANTAAAFPISSQRNRQQSFIKCALSRAKAKAKAKASPQIAERLEDAHSQLMHCFEFRSGGVVVIIVVFIAVAG